MGTTLLAAMIGPDGKGLIMNVGDSRGHLIDGKILHTQNQNLARDMVESGRLTEEEAMNHPSSKIVNQALGEIEAPVPDFYEFDIQGKYLLLSSDGLHDFVHKERIREIVLEHGSNPGGAVRSLIDEALRCGSDDNITVVLAWQETKNTNQSRVETQDEFQHNTDPITGLSQSPTRGRIPNEKDENFVIIGCGRAGIRILNQIGHVQEHSVKTVAIDTDLRDLEASGSDMKVHVENTHARFQGEGSPQEVAAAVLDAEPDLAFLFGPSKTVLIVAGLGRGAGTGSAPQIAKIARDRGALVIAIVFYPFRIQERTIRQAESGLGQLLEYADSVIVLDNQCSRNFFPHLSIEQGFAKYNEIIADLIRALLRSLTVPIPFGLDMDDFKAIFKKKGFSTVLMGKSRKQDQNKNESAVKGCINNPLWDIDYRSAKGCLVLVTGGNNFDLIDAEEITTSITSDIDPHADVVWSAEINRNLDEETQVYAIMTGIRVE